MALLQCEICGGRLTRKADDIYECDFCGMQYDTAWAKAKIQEIKGTVKVEGTVQVAGAVKVDGPVEIKGGANAKSMFQRAQLSLEDGDVETAEEYFKKVLSINPKRAEAYFGLAMIDEGVWDLEELVNTGDWTNSNFRRGVQFADGELKKQIENWKKEFRAREKERLDREAKQAAEENALREKCAEALRIIRDKYRETSRIFSAGYDHTVAVKIDGTIMVAGDKSYDCCKISGQKDVTGSTKRVVAVSAGQRSTVVLLEDGTVFGAGWYAERLSEWENITAVSAGGSMIVGLKVDGTVVAVGDNSCSQCDVSGWKDIVAIAAGYRHTVGLKKDGTVVATGKNDLEQCSVNNWKEIVAISATGANTVGLKADGTVKYTAYHRPYYDVKNWTDIIAISAGGGEYGDNIVGLCADGTVRVDGSSWYNDNNVNEWTDIVAISAGPKYIVGLRSDGTLVTAGNDFEGQSKLESWKLFDNADKLPQEREVYKEAKRLEAYQRACKLLDSQRSLAELREAERIFRDLGDYRDSEEQIRKCQELYPIVEKETKYRAACEKLGWMTISNMAPAKKLFEELGDWKDSRDKALWCEDKIRILQEIDQLRTKRKELENERAALGVFSGKRKKEIDAKSQKINVELAQREKELK